MILGAPIDLVASVIGWLVICIRVTDVFEMADVNRVVIVIVRIFAVWFVSRVGRARERPGTSFFRGAVILLLSLGSQSCLYS